jgi:hypothetical protein
MSSKVGKGGKRAFFRFPGEHARAIKVLSQSGYCSLGMKFPEGVVADLCDKKAERVRSYIDPREDHSSSVSLSFGA